MVDAAQPRYKETHRPGDKGHGITDLSSAKLEEMETDIHGARDRPENGPIGQTAEDRDKNATRDGRIHNEPTLPKKKRKNQAVRRNAQSLRLKQTVTEDLDQPPKKTEKTGSRFFHNYPDDDSSNANSANSSLSTHDPWPPFPYESLLQELFSIAAPKLETPHSLSMIRLLLKNQFPEDDQHRADGLEELIFRTRNNIDPCIELRRLLLKIRAESPSITSGWGRTALHMAALLGDLEVVRITTEKAAGLGGILETKDNSGFPILHMVARRKSESNSNLRDILQCLLNAGIDPSAKDNEGFNATHHAIAYNSVETVKVLLEVLRTRNADHINATTSPESGLRTCLHIAVLFGRTEMITWLLQNGAKTDVEDSSGKTAWDLCSARPPSADLHQEGLGKRAMGMDAFLEHYFQDEVRGNWFRCMDPLTNIPTLCHRIKKAPRYGIVDQVYLISANNRTWVLESLRRMFEAELEMCHFNLLAVYHFEQTFKERGNRSNGLIYREATVKHSKLSRTRPEVGLESDSDSDGEPNSDDKELEDILSISTCRSGGKSVREVHLPLTLDEYCNTGLTVQTLNSRNKDQVLVRYQIEQEAPKRVIGDSPSSWVLAPHTRLLMVHQIWIDVLAEGLILAFPENALEDEAIKHYVENPSQYRTLKKSPQARAYWTADLLSSFIRLLEQSTLSGLPEPALNIFQKSITQVTEKVDKDFANSSSEDHRGLADKERKLFHDISDIREELMMIGSVVSEQAEVWMELTAVLETKYRCKAISMDEWKATVNGCMSSTSRYLQQLLRRIEKLDKDAERVQTLIAQILDLKRSYSGIREAHWTAVMGAAVFIFTVVTVIFTPLSFAFTLLSVPKDSVLVGPVGDKGRLVGIWAGGAEFTTIVITGVAAWLAMWYFRKHAKLRSQRDGGKKTNTAESQGVRQRRDTDHGALNPSHQGDAGAANSWYAGANLFTTRAKEQRAVLDANVNANARLANTDDGQADTTKSSSKIGLMKGLGLQRRPKFTDAEKACNE